MSFQVVFCSYVDKIRKLSRKFEVLTTIIIKSKSILEKINREGLR